MIDLTAEIDTEKAKKQLSTIRAAAAKSVSGTISEFDRLDFYIDTLSGKIGRFGSNMNLAVLSARLKQAQLMARDAVKATSTGEEFEQIEQEAKKLNNTLQVLHKELGNVQNTAQGFNPLLEAVRSVHREVSLMIETIGRINPSATPRTAQSGGAAVGSTSATASTVAETAAVKAQNDIYDQLVATLRKVSYGKQEIAADIAQLKTQMAGYKATIDAVNKAERDSTITEQQANARAAAIVEYERTKNSVSALSKELAAQIKIEGEERNSIAQLNASLAALQSLYDKLSQTDRDGALGQQLNATIGDLQKKILGVETAMQAQNRTLGTYGSGFNALGFQIQQVARELPALAYGPQTFFSALSNNLPMLADEMARARKEINLLKKEGKEYVPIGKQIAGSIFSWQTLLVAGVTIFTMYGKEITAWVRSLFNGRKEIDAVAETQKQLHKIMGEGIVNAQQELTSARLMYEAATDITKAYDERRTAAQKLIDQHPAYLSDMSAEQVMLGNAKTAYEDLAKAIVATSKAKAAENELIRVSEAEISASLATEYKKRAEAAKSYRKRLQIRLEESRKNRDYGTEMIAGVQSTTSTEVVIGNTYKEEEDAFNDWVKTQGDKFEWIKKRGIKTFDEFDQHIESVSEELSKIAEINYTGGSVTDKNNAAKELANQAKQAKNLMAQLAADARQAEVDAMAEGTDKILAQINLDYDLREAEIKKREAELRALQGGKLTEEQTVALRSARKSSSKKYEQDIYSKLFAEDYESGQLAITAGGEQFDKERAAWNEHLIEYGSYRERLQAIKDKYDQLMAEAKTEGEKADLKAQMTEDLAEIESIAGTAEAQLMDALAGLEQMLADAEALYAEIADKNSPEAKAQMDYISELRNQFSKGREQLEKKRSARSGKGKDEKPDEEAVKEWQELQRTLSSVAREFEQLGEDIGGTAGAVISATGSIAANTVSAISGIVQFGTSSMGAIQNAANATQKAIAIVEASSVILAVLSAVMQIGQKIASLFGADYDQYNAMKARYENLIEVWDKLIDKKREYIAMSYGAEAAKATDEAIEITKQQEEAARQLGKERLNAGASAGSHSIGVRQRKRMNAEDKAAVQAVADEMGFDAASVFEGRMEGLFELSVEQLEQLMTNAPTFWAKLDGDVKEYLESIIESNEQIKELEKLERERLTQISWDDMYSSFVDTLMDMESSAQDFSKDFSEMMMRAMLATQLSKGFEKKLEKWYQDFAAANEDGFISESERQALQDQYNTYVDEAIDMRDKLAEVVGYGSTDAQSATARGFQAMDQETGSELNGRFTDLQMKAAQQLGISESVQKQIEMIKNLSQEQYKMSIDTRDLLINLSGNVSQIRNFAESLPSIQTAVERTNRILDERL